MFFEFYTISIMTSRSGSVIVCVEKQKGSLIRKGKAMLQIHTQNMKIEYRPYDLQGTIMLSANKAERFNDACLMKAGSGGCLKPGVRRYILE